MRTISDIRKLKARALCSRKFGTWSALRERHVYFRDEIHGLGATERHYTPAELGKIWGLSPETIRGLFEKESGVLIVTTKSPGKRRYRTFRIPEHVVIRVHTRLSP
jgi:hypothetical protein